MKTAKFAARERGNTRANMWRHSSRAEPALLMVHLVMNQIRRRRNGRWLAGCRATTCGCWSFTKKANNNVDTRDKSRKTRFSSFLGFLILLYYILYISALGYLFHLGELRVWSFSAFRASSRTTKNRPRNKKNLYTGTLPPVEDEILSSIP